VSGTIGRRLVALEKQAPGMMAGQSIRLAFVQADMTEAEAEEAEAAARGGAPPGCRLLTVRFVRPMHTPESAH
jgi:hypothetical protein